MKPHPYLWKSEPDPVVHYPPFDRWDALTILVGLLLLIAELFCP